MNPIGAGTLGRRIKIQRPSTIKDSLGAPSRTWIDVATVWADIQPLSGREAVIASRISAELHLTCLLRNESQNDLSFLHEQLLIHLAAQGLDRIVRSHRAEPAQPTRLGPMWQDLDAFLGVSSSSAIATSLSPWVMRRLLSGLIIRVPS